MYLKRQLESKRKHHLLLYSWHFAIQRYGYRAPAATQDADQVIQRACGHCVVSESEWSAVTPWSDGCVELDSRCVQCGAVANTTTRATFLTTAHRESDHTPGSDLILYVGQRTTWSSFTSLA